MHWTGTKHIVRHMQKSVVLRSVISKFTCIMYEYSPQCIVENDCLSLIFSFHLFQLRADVVPKTAGKFFKLT